jgi:regulator of sirC expression with transglutaminase-like and TPR domain
LKLALGSRLGARSLQLHLKDMKNMPPFFLVLIISIISPFHAFPEEMIESVERLSSLSEDQIDIGRVCLLFAKEAYPDLNVDEYSGKLDQMVKEIQRLTGDNTDPDRRIRALNTYLYQRQGFHYDHEDPYGQKLKNRYINGLLDTKSGSCFTMPLLYLALAQRLGYPVYPVSAPQHLFLRYVDPKLKMQNIEATGGGGYASDEDYAIDMEIPSRGIETGAYLKTMSYKDLLAELFVENAVYWAKNHNAPKAIRYFEESLKLNPHNAEVYRIFGNFHFELAKYELEKYQTGYQPVIQVSNNPLVQGEIRNIQLEYRSELISKGKELLHKADELGAAQPLPKNYWLIQERNRKEYDLSMEVKP